MIDLERGEVAYSIVSHGGFKGLGTDYFAVVLQEFEPSPL